MIQNRWSDADAPFEGDELAQRVYSSRLLGSDRSLVLHGGGNTSVKVTRKNLFGVEERLLLVKGSGWDLATIEPPGFTPLLMERVLAMAQLDRLSDLEMTSQLALARTDPTAPAPSVEAILHGMLDASFVDHTHADVIVTLTNTVHGEAQVRKVFDDSVVVLPYVMPGFELARLVTENIHRIAKDTRGLILMNHGIFTFGDTAKQSYDRMIELVSRAESALTVRDPLPAPRAALPHGAERRATIAGLRAEVSKLAGTPMILTVHDDDVPLAFAQHEEITELSGQGPATPDHVIRTKPVPMLGRDVAAFAASYREYFTRGEQRARAKVTMIDAAPRVVLDPQLGMITIGPSVVQASITEDIYRHTIEIILNSEALGGYRTISTEDLFNVEYWDLEQAKLRLAGARKPFEGQVALVTGAASGIGRAVSAQFLSQGAAVVGLDLSSDVGETFTGKAWLGVHCDVTQLDQVSSALDLASDRFGGLDVLVLNAGIFPPAQQVKDLDLAAWQRVMRVNLDSAVDLLRETHPLLRQSLGGGRVVVIGSKNVAAPGPGASAYSASKAALVQLARVIALEWAADAIRVNVIHPDAVFDTGIWANGVLASRAEHYGLTVEEYRTRNLLHVDITSADVAELVCAMTGPAFAKTTGAQVPIDGGNDRVI